MKNISTMWQVVPKESCFTAAWLGMFVSAVRYRYLRVVGPTQRNQLVFQQSVPLKNLDHDKCLKL